MMLIFGIFIVLASAADMILSSFSLNNLILLLMGLILTVVNISGEKPGMLKSITRLLLSLIVVIAALLTLSFIISENEPMDNEVAGIILEAKKLEEDQGYESSLEFLHSKNNELGWRREIVLAIGETSMEHGMYAQGADAYSDILRHTPDDMTIRHLYANALYMNKDYNGTLREGKYISRIDPVYDGAYVLMGDAYRGLNDNIREIYYYNIAVGLDENSVFNRIKLAEAYGNSHLLEKSVEQYEIAKELADTFEENSLVYESYLKFADTHDKETSQEVQ